MGLCTVVVLLSVAHAAAGLRPHFSSHWARRIDHTRILQPQHRVFNGQSADKGTDELNELALGTKMQSNECAAFGPTNGLSMAGDYALRTRTPVLLTESSLAARVDAAVCSIYGAEETRRVREAWARLARGEMVERQLVEGSAMMVQQANSYVEGLRAQPWHDVGKRKWAKKLESKWRIVRDELKAALADESSLLEKGNNVWAGAVDAGAGAAYGADWKTLVLCDRTVWDPVNSQLFPKTCEVLHASKVPLVEAFFAKMPPQTSIAPHSDMCNFVLTYHLGIIVPEGQCDLTVGDEKREWANGRAMLFDTSILHSAENRAPVTSFWYPCRLLPRSSPSTILRRYILMLRVYHDDLTSRERDALKLIFDCLDEPELVEDQQALEQYAARRLEVEAASRATWEKALAEQGGRSSRARTR